MTSENVDSAFSQALSGAVNDYLRSRKNGGFATTVVWVKAIVLLSLFFLSYAAIILADFSHSVKYFLAMFWGIVSLLIVFNIGHDAVHGTFSRRSMVNKILAFSFNLVGANAYSWYLKHNQAHHQFTNIDGKDHDPDMDPFLRVSPTKPYHWYFRWQSYYWPFVYMTLSLLIIFLADILIFFQEPKRDAKFIQPLHEWLILILSKLFYVFYMFFIPIHYGGFSFSEVLVAFFSIHAVNGLLIGLVFQPSHYFLETTFFTSAEGYKDRWYRNQLAATLDVAPDNQLLSYLLGSLNANVSHHLFPKISHVHYPMLSEVVQDICRQYQMPYFRKSFGEALRSHVDLLKKMSR